MLRGQRLEVTAQVRMAGNGKAAVSCWVPLDGREWVGSELPWVGFLC